MNALIDAALARSRSVLLLLALVLVAGAVSYGTIPKESEPDVAIPIIYVTVSHDGISPEDAEQLLVQPLEKELRSIEGIKELTAVAAEGHASVILEFEAGFDSEQALLDVREAVDLAKSELPADSDEPGVHEINVALFPVLVVTLYGELSEQTLVRQARSLRDKIEALPGVLDVEIAGDREEQLEAVISPELLETYNQPLETVLSLITRNNQLVAAGAMDAGAGRFAVKLPGLVDSPQDLLGMPLKTSGDKVVRLGDVASVRRTFQRPDRVRPGQRSASAGAGNQKTHRRQYYRDYRRGARADQY